MSEPIKLTIAFGTLLVLLALTVGVYHLRLGPWGPVAAVGIAGAKACLVAWFFMELNRADTVPRLFAVAGLAWLAILFVLTLADYLTREERVASEVSVSGQVARVEHACEAEAPVRCAIAAVGGRRVEEKLELRSIASGSACTPGGGRGLQNR